MINNIINHKTQGENALMPQNGVVPFQNETLNCTVRAVVKDGEPWFVAKDVCDALEKDDYETVGQKMYETHHGMSKLYEVSCEELDFLNDCAKEYGVTGSRVMGGGFGGCTINLVKNELYDNFVEKTKEAFKAKFGRSPKVYDVVIGDGSRKVE